MGVFIYYNLSELLEKATQQKLQQLTQHQWQQQPLQQQQYQQETQQQLIRQQQQQQQIQQQKQQQQHGDTFDQEKANKLLHGKSISFMSLHSKEMPREQPNPNGPLSNLKEQLPLVSIPITEASSYQTQSSNQLKESNQTR